MKQWFQICYCTYRIYSCISQPFTTKKLGQKIALDLYTSHTQRPDQAVREISKTTAWSASGKPVLIAVDFHQFLAHSSSTKNCEIINVKWFKRRPTGDYFYCVFWSAYQTLFSLRDSLIFTALNFGFHQTITIAWWPGKCLVSSTPQIRTLVTRFSKMAVLSSSDLSKLFGATFLWSSYLNLLLNSTSRSRVAKSKCCKILL